MLLPFYLFLFAETTKAIAQPFIDAGFEYQLVVAAMVGSGKKIP